VRNEIDRVFVLGGDRDLEWKRSGGAPWNNIPGILQIGVPTEALDEDVTVIGVSLKGALDLYHGAGGSIEVN